MHPRGSSPAAQSLHKLECGAGRDMPSVDRPPPLPGVAGDFFLVREAAETGGEWPRIRRWQKVAWVQNTEPTTTPEVAMPRLRTLSFLLFLSPMLIAGCETPTRPNPDAALRLPDRDSEGPDPLGKCLPPACRISFSLANSPAGERTGELATSPSGEVKPNDTTPWIVPFELPH